jgi:hypothetical protein
MKVRTAAGIKAVSAIHVRTAAGAGGLKTVTDGHVRIGAGGANLKDIWTPAGGGGVILGEWVSNSPVSKISTSATDPNNTSDFSAFFSNPPTSIVWSLSNVLNGTATIISGQGTNKARVSLTASGHGVQASCTVKCTALINGQTVFDTSTKKHTYS